VGEVYLILKRGYKRMKESKEFILSRIIIFGHDVDKLKTFYVDNFNFLVSEEMSGYWIVLKAGQMEIALHKIGPEYEPKNKEGFRAESNTKLVFQVRDNLKKIRQDLLNQSIPMGEIKSFKGIDALFCDGEDPEGNVFQIEQRLR
jgi:hypothetical protein